LNVGLMQRLKEIEIFIHRAGLTMAAKGVNMESPYMTFEETAAFFRRSVKTIRNWNSRDRKTGQKRMCGFPDPAHQGLFLRRDIENFGKLHGDD